MDTTPPQPKAKWPDGVINRRNFCRIKLQGQPKRGIEPMPSAYQPPLSLILSQFSPPCPHFVTSAVGRYWRKSQETTHPLLGLFTPFREGCLFCLAGFGVLSCCTHTCTTPAKPKTQASRFVSSRLSLSLSLSLFFHTHTHTIWLRTVLTLPIHTLQAH